MNDRTASPGLALLLAAVAVLTSSCWRPPESTSGEAVSAETTPPPSPRVPIEGALPAPSEGPLVVFLGDSLTAGLGIGEAESFPEQVRLLLAAEGVGVRAVNAGISGDTTAGGLARLDWVLRQKPDILVIGLGANDGLRGLAVKQTEANLRAIIENARRAGTQVLLLGMMLPPNYGPDYAGAFQEIFPRLARELEAPLVPFLLTGVAGLPELNQADGIHPTAEGHRLMAGNVLPQLRTLISSEPQPD